MLPAGRTSSSLQIPSLCLRRRLIPLFAFGTTRTTRPSKPTLGKRTESAFEPPSARATRLCSVDLLRRRYCIPAGLTSNGRFLVAGSEDHTFIVWDLQSRQVIQKSESHKGASSLLPSLARPNGGQARPIQADGDSSYLVFCSSFLSRRCNLHRMSPSPWDHRDGGPRKGLSPAPSPFSPSQERCLRKKHSSSPRTRQLKSGSTPWRRKGWQQNLSGPLGELSALRHQRSHSTPAKGSEKRQRQQLSELGRVLDRPSTVRLELAPLALAQHVRRHGLLAVMPAFGRLLLPRELLGHDWVGRGVSERTWREVR